MEALKISGSFDNVIYKVQYLVKGNSGSFSNTAINDVYLDIANITDFVSYEDTLEFEEKVFTWITGSIDNSKKAISSNIISQLEFNNNSEILTFS